MPSKNARREIALERIYRLFEVAEAEFKEMPERSKRYVQMARKISTRNKAPIPTELKRKFCRKCGALLVKGKNAEWKEAEKWVEISCGECGCSFKKGKG